MRKGTGNSMNEEEERALRPMKIGSLPKKKRKGERYRLVKKSKPRTRWVGPKSTNQ